jgi:hypothetical protein
VVTETATVRLCTSALSRSERHMLSRDRGKGGPVREVAVRAAARSRRPLTGWM